MDILKKLRVESRHLDIAVSVGDDITADYCKMCEEAADEIERFRTEMTLILNGGVEETTTVQALQRIAKNALLAPIKKEKS